MLFVKVNLEVDAWWLDPVVELLNDGAVGVIPTDTAIVCHLKSHSAIERLRRSFARIPHGCFENNRFRNLAVNLSLLNQRDRNIKASQCHSLKDIDTYTMGFPRGNAQGQTNVFRAVKHCLPGPYTFILPASKGLPKQCVKHGAAAKYATRKDVGVCIPDDAICRAITLDKHKTKDEWMINPVIIADIYEPEGFDFIVDGGIRVADPPTVVDMTGGTPIIIRQGKGPKQDWMILDNTDSDAHNKDYLLAASHSV